MLLSQSLNLAMIVFSALMIWKGLMFLTKSESPVVVVLGKYRSRAVEDGAAWLEQFLQIWFRKALVNAYSLILSPYVRALCALCGREKA